MTYQSILFKIIHYDYVAALVSHPKRTETDCFIKPLIQEKDGPAIGLRFSWKLRFFTGVDCFFSYISEEDFMMEQRETTTIKDLKIMAEISYNRSKREVNGRNIAVGLDATFPSFTKYTIDYLLVLSYLRPNV